MNLELIQRLSEAQTDEARQAIVLEMSLAALPERLQQAVKTAAVPHWFDALFFHALWGDGSRDLYDRLIELSFVELIPGRGYAIHERTRQQLLQALWQTDQRRFLLLSDRAAGYCSMQGEAPHWQAEAIYHRLISQPEQGILELQALATAWANYEYHRYGEIEHIVSLADEQITAGRLSGQGAAWTRLWQAKLALIYERSDLAASALDQISVETAKDPFLAAEVAQTHGDILAQMGDRAGMEKAWRSAYAHYADLEDGRRTLDAALVAEKMRQHGLLEIEAAAVGEAEPPEPPSANALKLIDNISAAWIEGVLKTTVDEKIDLHLARDGGQPANLVLHRPQGIDRPVAGGRRLSRLFAAADSALLILGAPGSGKTITLLQLLEELLAKARSDGDAPIPLLFNLSSFGAYAQQNDANLAGWLADQAYKQYRLNRQTTRDRLATGDSFILLLDGLDEVSSGDNMRERCVVAINQFMRISPCGLVVCSRIGDYQALNNQLALANALVLQPLTNGQIAAFVKQKEEPQRMAMLGQIASDWQLREVLRSPLLLHLYSQTFAAMQADYEREGSPSGDSVEARRQALFAAYVDTVFSRHKSLPVAEEAPLAEDKASRSVKSLPWLTFLASRMQQAGTTLFFVEELQPDWLPHYLLGRYRGLYGLLLGLVNGAFVWLVAWLIFGLSDGLSDGLIRGLIAGGAGAAATWVTTSVRPSWLRFGIGGLVTWLIVGLIGELFVWLIGGLSEGLGEGLFVWLIGGLFLGLYDVLGFSISMGIASLEFDIRLRERVILLRPTRQRLVQYIKRGTMYGFVVGLIFGLIFGLIVGESDGLTDGLIGGLIGGPIVSLIVGLIGALIFGILAFLDTPPVDKRPLPGKGVRSSMRNALLVTALATIFLGLPIWLIERQFEMSNFIILSLVLVNLLPPIFTWFGGLAWFQHWALRFLLYRRGWLPLRLIPWLDEMVTIGLLRRVGGGYIFIHRSLLEFFADQASEEIGFDKPTTN